MATSLIKRRQRGPKGKSVEVLNAQQQRFVHELMADRTFNATEAARQAGYTVQPASAANKLLKHPTVNAILGKLLRDREERLKITADAVMVELGKLAFSNIAQLYNEHGELIPVHQLPEPLQCAIESVEDNTYTDPDGTVVRKRRYKLHSKTSALELIARHLRLLNDRLQLDVDGKVQLDFSGLLQRLEDQRNVIDAPSIEAKAS